jgi:hypothetical protein
VEVLFGLANHSTISASATGLINLIAVWWIAMSIGAITREPQPAPEYGSKRQWALGAIHCGEFYSTLHNVAALALARRNSENNNRLSRPMMLFVPPGTDQKAV